MNTHHVTENTRAYNFKKIVGIADAIANNGWHAQSVIAVEKGSKVDCNMVATLEEIIPVDEEGKRKLYKIAGRDFTRDQILGMSETYEKNNVKKGSCFAVLDGRNRALAAFLVCALLGIDVQPKTLETSDSAIKVACDGNAANDHITAMDRMDKLLTTVKRMQEDPNLKEKDLLYGRGVAQQCFAQAKLVIVHKIPADKAVLLDKEKARNAPLQPNMTCEEAVDAAIAAKLAGNAPKVMSGKEIGSLRDLAKATKPEAMVTQLLEAICTRSPLLAEQLVMELVKL